MRRILFMAAAVGATLALAWWAATGTVSPPDLPEPPPRIEDRQADQPSVERRLAVDRKEPEKAAAPAHAFAVRITGRVTDAHSGAPIAGAVIGIEDAGAGTTADALGRYVLPFDLTEVAVWLSADHDDYTLATHQLENFQVPADGTVMVDFELAPNRSAAGVTGRIIEPGGSGIPGVEVLLSTISTARLDLARGQPHFTTKTGPDGRFAISALPPATYALFAIASQHRDYQRLGIELPPASRSDLGSIELEPFGWATLEGAVTDRDGQPVPNLQVEVRQGVSRVSAHTDENGTYRIERILPGSWAVFFTGPDKHFRTDRIEFSEGTAVRRDLVLRTGDHFIGGQVLIDGEPAPGLEVSCEPGQTDTADSWHRWTGVTDDEGRFRLTGLEDHSVSLWFSRKIPWLVYETSVVDIDREDHLFGFDTHRRLVTVVGTVHSRDGAPVAGATVAPPLPLSPAARAVTGVDGSYRIALQATTDSSFAIIAEHPAYLRQSNYMVVKEANPDGVIQSDFTLLDAWNTGTVTGTVTDPQGRGVGQVAVLAVGPDRTLWSCWTDSHGSYRFEDVAAGELDFRFSHRAYAVLQGTHHLSAGQELTVDGRLEALATLSRTVEVIDSTGAAVARQQVDVWDARGAHVGGGRTDERGQVTITDLPAGPVRISVEVADHPRHELLHEIAGPRPAPLRLRLTVGGASIRGVVLDGDGGPLAEDEITLASTAEDTVRIYEIGSTDKQGRFQFDRLPEGEYELEVWTTSGRHRMAVRTSGPEVLFRIR